MTLGRARNAGLLMVTLALAAVPTRGLRAETLAFSDVSARVVLGLRVPETALRRWLPNGWQLSPVGAGPSKGANLVVGFVDRMLHLDPAGQLIGGGVDRFVGLVIPAKGPGVEKPVSLVIRIYQNAGMLPGAYKNTRAASIKREHSGVGANTSPSDGSESWEVSDGAGGAIALRFTFRGGTPVRTKQELPYYSAVEPAFYRIYRFQQGADVVRSTVTGVDRVQGLQLTVTVPELREMFDGNQELTSIAVVPWNSRQVFLP